MATTSVQIRMDTELKKQFEAFCKDVGMSMSGAVNVFARKAVREQRIPFSIGTEMPNEATAKAIEDTRNGVGLSGSYESVEALMEALDADD